MVICEGSVIVFLDRQGAKTTVQGSQSRGRSISFTFGGWDAGEALSCVQRTVVVFALSSTQTGLCRIMANSFVCLWQELLRVVQDVSKQDPDLSSATKKSEVLTTKLNSLPPQPKSAWKRVVRDIQVGRTLRSVCAVERLVWQSARLPQTLHAASPRRHTISAPHHIDKRSKACARQHHAARRECWPAPTCQIVVICSRAALTASAAPTALYLTL